MIEYNPNYNGCGCICMAYALVDRVVAIVQCSIDCIPWAGTDGSVAAV